MNAKFLPWLDRAGRFSALKAIVLVMLFVPGLWVALQLSLGWLQPKPVTEAIHQIGTWAVRFLLLSLAITPLRKLGSWSKLISVRRMLGLAVLAYASIHLVLYVVDQHYDLAHVASEIVLRFYLTIGFLTLLGFAALGLTSTDGMIRRLGAKRWNRLHQSIYLLGVLALWHFLLQAKLDITQPVLMVGLFLILMGYRVLQWRKLGDSIPGLLAVALLSATATALVEAGWYQVVNHVPAARVLSADLDFSDTIRPAWWVLLAGLAVVLLRALRPLWVKQPTARAVATPRARSA